MCVLGGGGVVGLAGKNKDVTGRFSIKSKRKEVKWQMVFGTKDRGREQWKDRGSVEVETKGGERKGWRRAVSGPLELVCRLLTLFPRCSLQRTRIMKRARGFRQWERKKITSKLAARLNWDNPETVAVNACSTGSDVPFFPPSLYQPHSVVSSLNLAPSVALLLLDLLNVGVSCSDLCVSLKPVLEHWWHS